MEKNKNQLTSQEEAAFIVKVEGEARKNLNRVIEENSFQYLKQQHNYTDADAPVDIDWIDSTNPEFIELINREVYSLSHCYSYIVKDKTQSCYNKIDNLINLLIEYYTQLIENRGYVQFGQAI